MLLLTAFLHSRLPGLLDASFLRDIVTLLPSGAVAGLVAVSVDVPISHLPLPALLLNLVELLFGGLAGAGAYAAIAAAFGWREHERVVGLWSRRG